MGEDKITLRAKKLNNQNTNKTKGTDENRRTAGCQIIKS